MMPSESHSHDGLAREGLSQSGAAGVSVSDRVVATLYFLIGACIVVGAKASPFYLAVIVIAEFSAAQINGRRPESTPLSKMTALCFLAFAAFCAISAIWAKDSLAAIQNALQLGLIIGAVSLASMAISSLPAASVVLRCGWFAIGFVIGECILAHEAFTRHDWSVHVLNALPFLIPSGNSMLVVSFGKVIAINSEMIVKWSVAGLNLMLWPALAIVTFLSTEGRRKVWVWLPFALAALTTLVLTKHATSQIAIVCASVGFVIAHYWQRPARMALVAAWVALTVCVVPAALFAGHIRLFENPNLSESAQQRVAMWDYTARRIVASPVFGSGAGATRSEFLAGTYKSGTASEKIELLDQPLVHPHNIYMQIWHELGAAGAIIFLVTGLYVLRSIANFASDYVPFAQATWITAIVEMGSSWDLWYGWFLALLGVTAILTSLAARLAQREFADSNAGQVFASVWLPGGQPGTNGGSVTYSAVVRPALMSAAALTLAAVALASYAVLHMTGPRLSAKANLALGKPATMSSAAIGTTADRAVDDDINGDSNWFHTGLDTAPWWMVDLQSLQDVAGFEIFNRTDCCTERAASLTILLSIDGAAWQTVYVHDKTAFGGGKDERPLRVKIAPHRARFVKIQLAETHYFHLSEVRVFGAHE